MNRKQKIHDFFAANHNLFLTESEMADIINELGMNLLKEVKRAVLNGYGSHIRQRLLSEKFIDLYRCIDSGLISTSSQLAKTHGITAASANGKMKRLFDAGYVERDKVVMHSGGMEYFYYTT